MMNRKMISVVKHVMKKPVCLLFALSLALAGCSNDEDDTSSKLFFRVYDSQSPLNYFSKNPIPAPQAEIKLYSKTGDQYTLLETVETDDKGEALVGGTNQQTIYYEVTKGKKTNLYNGYTIIGTFTSLEEIANSAYHGPGTKPGDLILKDVNGDAMIDSADKVPEKYASETFGIPGSTLSVVVCVGSPS